MKIIDVFALISADFRTGWGTVEVRRDVVVRKDNEDSYSELILLVVAVFDKPEGWGRHLGGDGAGADMRYYSEGEVVITSMNPNPGTTK